MNYTLAQKLKWEGFPQEGNGLYEYGPEGSIYIPTLSELIESCGEFKKLCKHTNGKWTAHAGTKTGKDSIQAGGDEPEEAVANLWLKLKE